MNLASVLGYKKSQPWLQIPTYSFPQNWKILTCLWFYWREIILPNNRRDLIKSYCILNVAIPHFGFFSSGFGTAMVRNPGYFMINEYFEKWKATAMGLCCAGYGVAMLVVPPLMLHLFTHYGHQRGLLIIAALCLHGCVGGALFRPLEQTSSIDSKRKSNKDPQKIARHKHVSFNVRPFLNADFLSFMALIMTLGFCTSVLSGLLPALAVENDISMHNATMVLALMGIGDIFGSTLLGFILDCKYLRDRRFYWISGCNMIVAICVGMNPFFFTTIAFILLAITRSVFNSHIVSQRLTLLSGIVSRDEIHGAMGIMLFCQATGSLAGRGIGGE